MSERFAWQRFYRAAEDAGYFLGLPDVRDRLDFRNKLTKYTGRDPKKNKIRPVYITGKGKIFGTEFFRKWHGPQEGFAEEKAVIEEMMRVACAGDHNMALSFAHHKGYGGLEQEMDHAFTTGLLNLHGSLTRCDNDKLVAAFLEKEELKK